METKPTFREAFNYWFKLGFINFGGPIVGVILNLSVIFTYHVLLPEGKGFDWYALSASLVAFVGMIRFKWGMIPVIIGSALAGYIWKQIL